MYCFCCITVYSDYYSSQNADTNYYGDQSYTPTQQGKHWSCYMQNGKIYQKYIAVINTVS